VRVLLADDEPISRRLLEGLLRHWGYETVAVGDGLEAWQLLTGNEPPQVAVLDWLMPGLDGVTLCRSIREHDRLRSTYVILVTGKRSAADVAEAYAAGVDAVVEKPVAHEALEERLRHAARLVRARPELEELGTR